ncbi:hypothetical protein [Spirillospora sp. NPDC047279]|uniref:hypothetical protein n=1 Tax=Spirillospora sp. NPDC047279 TaxID=3155478 RepID=UPI0033F8DBA7
MDTRPDPRSATTQDEFLEALRRLRAWAGQPSLRTLTALAGRGSDSGRPPADLLPVSTLSDNLAGKRLPNLPRLPFVVAFVGACLRAGGEHAEEEIAAETDRWTRAWHALSPDAPDKPSLAPAPAGRSRGRGRLPLLTGFLGAAVGAAVVWLAMPGASAPATPAAVIQTTPGSTPAPGRPTPTRSEQPDPTPSPNGTPPRNAQPRPGSKSGPPASTTPRPARTRPAPSTSPKPTPTPTTSTPFDFRSPYRYQFTLPPAPTPYKIP